MSGKRIKVFSKSLEKPHFRYVTSAAITYYPQNSDRGQHFYRMFKSMCQKYSRKKIQENFTWQEKISEQRDLTKSSEIKMEFLDGTQFQFDFTKAKWEHFLFRLWWINEEIEATRNLQGHDDEPDDEEVEA